MNFKEISKKVNSVILCLMAHPDNEPDSEFADRIDDLIDVKDQIDQVNGAGLELSNCNLANVTHRNEQFKAFLRVLEEVDNDNATITDEDAFIDEFLKSL